MVQLADIRKQAAKLSREDQEGLLTSLIHDLDKVPTGPDDTEVDQRDAEMDSGAVTTITHSEFLAQVGRTA